ncbi:MAG: class I SAM-dependent methyltransferase [Pseudomonadota bacterium]
MDFEQIKQYWEQRAAADTSTQSTTQDYYLREVEVRALLDAIAKHRPRGVMDVGCGDAWTTIRLASAFPDIEFLGGDYSSSMLRNAEANLAATKLQNVRIESCDITRPMHGRDLDLLYTTRCLINLPSWELQRGAIENIRGALSSGGIYVMIENFIEGHENFNQLREAFGLPPIPVRSHNLFFERSRLFEYIKPRFEVIDETNISSTYYLVSRIIYAKICQDKAMQPDYFDDHHRYASALPFCGEYGPVRMLCLRKK